MFSIGSEWRATTRCTGWLQAGCTKPNLFINIVFSLPARHCFSLEDFVRHAALPSLVKACGGAGVTGNPANAPSPDTGARLTCHLLLRLFKTVDTPQPGQIIIVSAAYSVATRHCSCWRTWCGTRRYRH